MQYRHRSAVTAAVLASLAAVNTSVQTGGHFRGPPAVCLSHTTLSYPCVFLSLPAYRPNPTAGMAAPEAGGWPVRMRTGEAWTADPRSRVQDVSLEPAWGQTGAAVKLGPGALKFKLYSGDGGLSDPRFYLGIDRSW